MAHQNKVFFRKFKKNLNSFTSEMLIFDNFFSKWSQMKTNEDKGMKPTLKGHNYTKFSHRERSSLLSHSSLEYMYFKGRTEVEVGDLIFCREIFPYLESSLILHKPRPDCSSFYKKNPANTI